MQPPRIVSEFSIAVGSAMALLAAVSHMWGGRAPSMRGEYPSPGLSADGAERDAIARR